MDHLHLPSRRIAAARLFRTLIGPLLLLLLTFAIMQQGEGWFTAADVVFLLTLAAIVAGRWLEWLGEPRVHGAARERQTAAIREFMAAAAILWLFVWGMANLLGNHLLN